jgi:hypothetical protein
MVGYDTLVRGYAQLVPSSVTAVDIEERAPGSVEVVQRIIDTHFSCDVPGQLAVWSLGAALIFSEETVKNRIRSSDLTDREREIFRMLLMYDRELSASKRSTRLLTITQEL